MTLNACAICSEVRPPLGKERPWYENPTVSTEAISCGNFRGCRKFFVITRAAIHIDVSAHDIANVSCWANGTPTTGIVWPLRCGWNVALHGALRFGTTWGVRDKTVRPSGAPQNGRRMT